MKHRTRSLLSPALAFCLPVFALHAQTPAGGDPFVKDSAGVASAADAQKAVPSPDCLLVFEVYALDKNDALGVLESERGSAARYRRVIDIAKAGKARLEILTALTSRSGQRALTESIDEVRFPTEFKQPRGKSGIAAPAAFETRNVGDVIEFEPVVGPDGIACDLNLVPQRVGLAGFRDVEGTADDFPISQPLFNLQKLTTSAALTDGEPKYLGTFSPQTPQGIANGGAVSEVWLAFIHMSVLRPEPDRSKAPVKPDHWSSLNLEYTCYSLERAQAREILLAPAPIDSPWEKLQGLIGEKKARFEGLATIITKSGQRAVSEGTQEFPYATGYTPERRIGTVENTARTTITGPTPKKENKAPAGKESEKSTTTTETIAVTRAEPNAERISGGPAAIEKRDLGTTVEVEPIVAPDNVNVDVNEAVQSVALFGNLKVTGIAAHYPAQPVFESRKIITSQRVPAGRHALVGTLNPPGADGVNDRADSGRTWLLFVRVTPNEP